MYNNPYTKGVRFLTQTKNEVTTTMKNTNKMAPNSIRIGFSKENYTSREEAREAGNAYLNALEPKYQLGRSFKVCRLTGVGDGPGTYGYDIYLGQRPIESYRNQAPI